MRWTREKLAAGAVVALLVLTGCGGSGGSGDAQDKQVPAAATGSLEDLAADVNCKPNIQTDADEIRQAICKNGDGQFILATFATDRGQREWINDAKDYGGYYLVGRKWVAVGEDKVVKALQTTLGGEEEIGADMMVQGARRKAKRAGCVFVDRNIAVGGVQAGYFQGTGLADAWHVGLSMKASFRACGCRRQSHPAAGLDLQ